MANRRVSFAPEATLHTWSVMELAEDSTTSSSSNSTRRQSSMTAQQSPLASEAPQVPAPPQEEALVKASPAKKRRRESEMPPAVEDDPDEAFSSSPSGDVSIIENSPARSMGSEDTSDGDEGDTAMSMEDTTNTMASEATGSTDSSLDERLRRAASQAGTRGIDYDENGDDLPMEMATGTVTNAFQPWVQSRAPDVEDLSAMQDQENINPFSQHNGSTGKDRMVHGQDDDQDEDQTMEMTKAVGGIVANSSPGKRRKSVGVSRRRSSVGRRRSSGNASNFGDETMDFTAVGGSILPSGSGIPETDNESMAMSDEDMTMELTNVLGGVVNDQSIMQEESIQRSQIEESETMDETAAVGGILETIDEQTEPISEAGENTITMDITKAVGMIMREEQSTPTQRTPSERRKSGNMPIASETGSPSLAPRSRSASRKSTEASEQSTTPKSTPRQQLGVPGQATPSKQMTPLPGRPETPNKTPLSTHVSPKSGTQTRLFQAEIKARASPATKFGHSAKKSDGVFAIDAKTGQHTPSVVLHAPKPHQHLRRRSSGIGIDQEGMGSPRVTELLSKRSSIGDSVSAFVAPSPAKRSLRFEDPRTLEAEIDAEREGEGRRESGRFIMEQEADEPQEENATLQLKEMIASMSPKKDAVKKLKGRKSLAVGAAKGVLGKRPVELDMDDDEEELTPKRLKAVSRESSPVKKIHLPKPPPKAETLRRFTQSPGRANQVGSSATPVLGRSPSRRSVARSPDHTGHFKELQVKDGMLRPSSFEDKLDNVMGAIDMTTAQIEANGLPDEEDEKITLQSFLNMTNIHFIELSTTKRRHTAAPEPNRPSQEGVEVSLESCFAAAATTLPLLELYQHATRELKSYISSGRKLIRTIEVETLADQPQLFREYVDAKADVKMIMDNQFRNGKSNARLQSKQGWYIWREQLVDGLRGGLEGIDGGMQKDIAVLDKQLDMLSDAVPQLRTHRDRLEKEVVNVEERVEEFSSIDLEALSAARFRLKQADEEYQQKMKLLRDLEEKMSDKTEALTAAEELKVEMKDQISEADRVREECRGIPTKEVLQLESRVHDLQRESGWRLVSAEEDSDDANEFGVALTLLYKDSLRLFFYPAAFQARDGKRRSKRRSKSNSGPTAPVSLTYSPDEETPAPLSTEQRFFLQLIKSQVQVYSMMPRGSISARMLLRAVSTGWDTAAKIGNELRLLNMSGIVSVSILSDERLGATLKLMTEADGRVDLSFDMSASNGNDGNSTTSSSATATAVYGRIADVMTSAKAKKVQTALNKEIEGKNLGTGSWLNAVQAFEQWVHVQIQPKAAVESQNPPAAVTAEPVKTIQTPRRPAVVVEQELAAGPPRSPLTAKKPTQMPQKRAIPIPITQRAQQQQQGLQSKTRAQATHAAASTTPTVSTQQSEKENIPPPATTTTIPTTPPSAQTHHHHHQPHQPQSQPQPHEPTKQQEHKKSAAEIHAQSWEKEGEQEEPLKPAMDPWMQQALMQTGTPIKRVGALRRSPI